MSRQSLVKAKSFYVMTEYILRRDRGFQDIGLPCRDIVFYVATMGHGAASQQGWTRA